MPNPLTEVFGFPVDSLEPEAIRHRANKLCPFNNKTPNCRKVSVEDPLGVCSLYDQGRPTIICPVRYNEGWRILEDAAEFFFPGGTRWVSVPEVRLTDGAGEPAGNIDFVLVSHDESGNIINFGSLEIQAVYISGNLRNGFTEYMRNPRPDMDWNFRNPPRPDFLSSSRKRLAAQLLFKGGILHAWGKKQAIAIDVPFFSTLPNFEQVPAEEAELALFVYNLQRDGNVFNLVKNQTVYTKFETTMETMTKTGAGEELAFIQQLKRKLKDQLRPF